MPARTPLLALLALALLVACGAEDVGSPETDDWGGACESDDDCPGALTCLCGLCTTTCVIVDDRSGCRFGTCLNPAQVDRCGDPPPSPRVCGVRCVEDAECKNLGTIYVCDGGVCARGGS